MKLWGAPYKNLSQSWPCPPRLPVEADAQVPWWMPEAGGCLGVACSLLLPHGLLGLELECSPPSGGGPCLFLQPALMCPFSPALPSPVPGPETPAPLALGG